MRTSKNRMCASVLGFILTRQIAGAPPRGNVEQNLTPKNSSGVLRAENFRVEIL